MAVTADWQVELNGLLTGTGTVYRLGPDRISGLFGVPPAKTRDVDLVGQDGAIGSADFMGPRIVIVAYVIVTADVGAALSACSTLSAAWEPGASDIQLHVQLPGLGHKYLVGRPRGLEVVMSDRRLLGGVLPAMGEFHALDPTLHSP